MDSPSPNHPERVAASGGDPSPEVALETDALEDNRQSLAVPPVTDSLLFPGLFLERCQRPPRSKLAHAKSRATLSGEGEIGTMATPTTVGQRHLFITESQESLLSWAEVWEGITHNSAEWFGLNDNNT